MSFAEQLRGCEVPENAHRYALYLDFKASAVLVLQYVAHFPPGHKVRIYYSPISPEFTVLPRGSYFHALSLLY